MITPTPIARLSCRTFRGLLLAVFSILALGVAAYGASRKNFDLPAGDAAKTLKSFSDQSGEQIVYPVEQVRGLQTNTVRGELTPREALDAMLERTGLIVVQDEATGALSVKRATVPDTDKNAAPRQDAPAAPRSRADARPGTQGTGDDEIIVMSPFEVAAGRETGYAAATTLAGNRLNTELRDVGSAITVVTAQMLRDIGATSNETLLQYTTNTEVGNIYGNMANAGGGTQLDETGKFKSPNTNTRVRGLAAADGTIDYFLSDIPWDSYNVDRIDFQRGPNAILFGLGSPAGIINAGTKQAGFKTRGEAELRYSRFGSLRFTLDYNQVLLANQLAIRVAALSDTEKFQQEPAYQKDRRIYGAVRYEPAFLNKGSAHTTFRANFEQGNIRSNRPRTLTPGDAITPWFYTGTAQGYDAAGNSLVYNNLNRIGFDARGLQDTNIASIGANGRGQFVKNYNNTGGLPSGALNPYWQPWLGGQFGSGYFGNPMAIFASGDNPASTLVNWEPSTIRGISSAGAIDRTIGGIPFSRMSSITIYRDVSKKVNLPGAKFGLTKNLTLSDPSIFDFYNQLIDGPNKQEWQNFKRYDLNLSQTFLDGTLGVEAAYDWQHYDNGQMNFMTDKGQTLNIDMIQIEADGTVNPNFGRPFIVDTGAGGNRMLSDREAFRLTGFAAHDFNKGRQSWFTRLLGRHVLTGLYSNDTSKSESYSFVHWVADNAYKDFINGFGSSPATIDSSVRKVAPTIYLGPSLANASNAVDAHIPNPSTQGVVGSGSIRAFDSTWIATNVNPADPWQNTFYPVGHQYRTSTQSENPANYRGWINTPITITDAMQSEANRDLNTSFASRNKNNVESKAIIWQGYFWDGAVVGMYGYRNDRSSGWAKTADRNTDTENRPNLDRTGSFKLPANANVVEKPSSSWSAVVHLNRFFKQKLPLDVSLYYNQSENFQPLAGRVGPLSNLLTPPTGNTKDFGILFATNDNRYSFKVIKYKTSVFISNGTHGFNPFYLGQLFTDYQAARNRFVFEVSDPTRPESFHQGDPSQWTYQPGSGQTAAQALAAQQADVAGWESFTHSLPAEFFSAWKIDLNQTQLSQLKALTYQTPNNFQIPEDSISKGWEFEVYAQPIPNLRLNLNASKQKAVRSNIGDSAFNTLVNQINTALNTTAAGTLRSNSGSTAVPALQSWNANFWASWLSIKGTENTAVGELRPWRANLIANYDFDRGFLKGVNVGIGCRWQDKVVIGYQYDYLLNGQPTTNPFTANSVTPNLAKPFYGPAETNVDLWVGYRCKLTPKLAYRVQLNVRNVGKGNGLIPVTTQPDGTVAAWRIAPTQVWSLTNTIEF
jgi:outer membrane receptor protein involved in Fe transport